MHSQISIMQTHTMYILIHKFPDLYDIYIYIYIYIRNTKYYMEHTCILYVFIHKTQNVNCGVCVYLHIANCYIPIHIQVHKSIYCILGLRNDKEKKGQYLKNMP